MDKTAFLARYPEFASTNATVAGAALIDAALAETLLELDPEIWGNKLNAGHGALTAHRLAVSPSGNAAKLSNKDGTSTYGHNYMALLRSVSGGGMLL